MRPLSRREAIDALLDAPGGAKGQRHLVAYGILVALDDKLGLQITHLVDRHDHSVKE